MAARTRLARVFLLALIVVGVLIPMGGVTAQADGIYRVKSVGAGSANLCLWAPSSTRTVQLELNTCVSGQRDEQWNFEFITRASTWSIVNQAYAGCLDVYQNNQNNGAKAVDWSPCSTLDSAQMFIVAATGSCSGGTQVQIWQASGSMHRLDDYGTSHSRFAIVDFWQGNGSSAQLWCLIGP